MRRARSGVVAVLVVVLAGCGGAGHPRRDAVNAYFVKVDRAETPLLTRRIAINTAFARFSMGTNPPAEVTALKMAKAQILAAEKKVGAIDPPPDAAKIHAQLLALLRLEASLTDDLLLTTAYAPRFKQALQPLNQAGTTLAQELKTARGWSAQAAAFAHYREALEPVVAQVQVLHAPAVLEPTRQGELQALRKRVRLSAAVESALRAKDAKAANTSIRALFDVSSDAVRTRKAEIVAARAYNARITKISVLTAAIAKERQALIRSIG